LDRLFRRTDVASRCLAPRRCSTAVAHPPYIWLPLVVVFGVLPTVVVAFVALFFAIVWAVVAVVVLGVAAVATALGFGAGLRAVEHQLPWRRPLQARPRRGNEA
jgi:hypothetical protein